jgi:hypothetical protein
VVQLVGGPDTPRLEAAMSLIYDLILRGEKTRASTTRCHV